MARYIDADLLIKNISGIEDLRKLNTKTIGEFIKNTPTADVVQVKHGKWITLEAEIGLYSCSLCEHNILRAECNYCPNCGAKMDGGETE